MEMGILRKKIAIISSGFLRNYRFFLRSPFYKYILKNFDVGVHIGTWEEDGYGSNSTLKYTSNKIDPEEVKKEFGSNLKFLKMNSFSKTKDKFKYDPIKNLLRGEPHVLEKYRSKYFCLSEIKITEDYDVYFHIRFDVFMDEEISKEIISKIDNFQGNKIYTSRDVYERSGCVGDLFQICSYDNMIKIQKFNETLYSDLYLNKDIHHIPERILYEYFLESNLVFEPISCSASLIREKCPFDNNFENIWEWWHNNRFRALWEFKKHETFGNFIDNENSDQTFWCEKDDKILLFNKERKLTSELKKIKEGVYSGVFEYDKNIQFAAKKFTREIDYK